MRKIYILLISIILLIFSIVIYFIKEKTIGEKIQEIKVVENNHEIDKNINNQNKEIDENES